MKLAKGTSKNGEGWNAKLGRNWILILASASLTAFLGACGSSGGNSAKNSNDTQDAKAVQSEWMQSVNLSGIDGKTVTRTRVFNVAGNGARVKVILTCLVNSKHLAMNIESYSSDGETPSSFVSRRIQNVQEIDDLLRHPQRKERPVGRIKFAAADTIELARLFASDKYSNVITWDVSESADRFLADEYGERRLAAETAVADQFPEDTYDKSMTVDQWNKDQDRRMPEQRETASKAYASGNYLQNALPIFIEASNGQGTFEIQIPNDDPGVNDFLRSCASSGLTSAQLASIFVFDPPKGSSNPRTPSAEPSVAPVSNAAAATSSSQSTAETQPTSPAAPQAPIAASFDCSKAFTIVEKLICSNPQLAAADNDMAAEYRRVYSAAGPNAPAVKQSQRDFISKRNQCSTSECVAEAYQARRTELAQLSR